MAMSVCGQSPFPNQFFSPPVVNLKETFSFRPLYFLGSQPFGAESPRGGQLFGADSPRGGQLFGADSPPLYFQETSKLFLLAFAFDHHSFR